LNPIVAASAKVETPKTVKAMPIDFPSAATSWDTAAHFIEYEFLANDK
jgi:hypothetical protein